MNKISQKIIGICGMLGPIIFTLMWIIGGVITPGYDHIRDDISSLLAMGAPNKVIMDVMNISTSILLWIFFLGLHKSINDGSGSKLGPIMLIISGFLGLLLSIFFPLDVGGEPTTWIGMTHVILVFAQIPLVAVAMVALWRRFRKESGWKSYGWISIIAFILTMIFGFLTPGSVGGPYMGLVERLAVCTIELYFFLLGLGTFLNAEPQKIETSA
jgi:hypothetical membrane protein